MAKTLKQSRTQRLSQDRAKIRTLIELGKLKYGRLVIELLRKPVGYDSIMLMIKAIELLDRHHAFSEKEFVIGNYCVVREI